MVVMRIVEQYHQLIGDTKHAISLPKNKIQLMAIGVKYHEEFSNPAIKPVATFLEHYCGTTEPTTIRNINTGIRVGKILKELL